MGLEEDYKKSMKDLDSTKEFFLQKIIPVKRSIDWIIKMKSHNKTFIEKTLNELLWSSTLGVGNDEFHRLNDYYSTIFPQSANGFKKTYEKVCGRNY